MNKNMKNIATLSLILAGALFFVACKSETKSTETAAVEVKVADDTTTTSPAPVTSSATGSEGTASTALDVNGTYRGVIPCADCEGIETELILNADKSFKKSSKYLGKSDKPVLGEGRWEWLNGNTIKLNDPKETPSLIFVSEGKILMLDKSGNRITGNLAEKYYLYKAQ